MKKHMLLRIWNFAKSRKQLRAFHRFEGEGAAAALDRLVLCIGGYFGLIGTRGNVPYEKGHRGQ